MRTKEIYLCMQDGIHLATKIRNRLLSTIATLSIKIENYSKFDHNLLKNMNTKGTYIYLHLLKLVIIIYIKAGTDIFVRL